MESQKLKSQKRVYRFIEVNCKSSGNIRRFSSATKAGFALQIINRKLGDGVVPGSYIEAVKK
ncbi:hypothetical protein Syun_004020 [Stephania yunnanensis]|uniref:Uncharacterized protein n=1 Tax=Stephania yunnanensis TaxID=152371 RepID=A0AAP0Q0S9_9MAGN